MEGSNFSQYNPFYHDFILGKETVVDILKNPFLTNDGTEYQYNTKLCGPLLVPLNKKNDDCISAENLFDELISRWQSEINYEKEVMQLKEGVAAHMEKYAEKQNKLFQDEIQTQILLLIDSLMNFISLEEKQLVGQFCISIMNGFETEALFRLHKIVKYLFRPFQIQNISVIFAKFKKTFDSSLKNISDIKKSVQNLIQLYQKKTNFTIVDSNLNNLEQTLIKLENKSEQCILKFTLNKETSSLLPLLHTDIRWKTIKSIEVESSAFDYAQNKGCPCEKLTLKDADSEDLLNSIQYMSRVLESVDISCNRSTDEGLIKVAESMLFLGELDYLKVDMSCGVNEISDVSFVKFVNTLSYHENSLIELDLNFSNSNWAQNNVTDFSMNAFSLNISKLKNLTKFCLNLSNFNSGLNKNCITDKGFIMVTTVLGKLIQLEILTLQFSNYGNKITSTGVNELCKTLLNLKKLKKFIFEIDQSSDITDQAATNLSQALISCCNLEEISLNFSELKNITDNGIMSFANCFKQLKKLREFFLIVGENEKKLTAKGKENLKNQAPKNIFLQIV